MKCLNFLLDQSVNQRSYYLYLSLMFLNLLLSSTLVGHQSDVFLSEEFNDEPHKSHLRIIYRYLVNPIDKFWKTIEKNLYFLL